MASFVSKQKRLSELAVFSLKKKDASYLAPKPYAMLLDVVEYLEDPDWVQTFLVDLVAGKPCRLRTIYAYFTIIAPKPQYASLTNYVYNNRKFNAYALYEQSIAFDRRKHNDVFARNTFFQIKHKGSLLPAQVAQIRFFVMFSQNGLFDFFKSVLPQILQVMDQEKPVLLVKLDTILNNTLIHTDVSETSEPDLVDDDYFVLN
jgi:hypothetical protein